MTKEKIASLIALAKANHAEAAALARVEQDKAAAELYATLGDKAKPFVDNLFKEIEQRSSSGIVEYRINDLPQHEFIVDYHNLTIYQEYKPNVYAKANSVTGRLVGILKEYDIKSELCAEKNPNYPGLGEHEHIFFVRVKL